jgi:phosphoribosylformylglycinamidine synthase
VKNTEAQKTIDILRGFGCEVFTIGAPIFNIQQFQLDTGALSCSCSMEELRKKWFLPSFLLEEKQTVPALAKERYQSLGKNPLKFKFPDGFNGKARDLGCNLIRTDKTGAQAAIIREKGTNGEREMAYSLYAAGFDVKDVMMTDLTEGRETLDDIRFIVFCGGFSNSDVLGSAKGWAGSFKYNEKARDTLLRFYGRNNTLSLGICNGCQLMVALDLVYPDHEQKVVMRNNDSGKFESSFLNVDIQPNTKAVMLQGMQYSKLGIWVAHGEGKFMLPEPEDRYDIPVKYISAEYPVNPNGSSYNAAAIVSHDGRHLAMMPHLERAVLPWQWPYYPIKRKGADEVTPWMQAFMNAKNWIVRS